ncbi:TPA: hypothetical protein KSJ92_001010 [Clostridioides difficile]|nr:hypothetical protein [Clostridioides difficile]
MNHELNKNDSQLLEVNLLNQLTTFISKIVCFSNYMYFFEFT